MDVFDEARRELYFPPVRFRLIDGDGIKLNFAGRFRKPEVAVGRSVFLRFSKLALKGLFQLSLARWIKHPYSLKVALLEEFWLKDYEKKKRIIELFDTIICSLYLTWRGCSSIKQAIIETMNRDKADLAVRSYLTRRTGINFGDLSGEFKEVEEAVEAMESIQFDRCSNIDVLRQSILSFAETVNKLIESKEEVFDFNIGSMDKAIQEVAGEVGVREFREISEYFGIGKGAGDPMYADIQWYIHRSAKYSIRVENPVTSGDYPGRLVDFSPDEGIDRYSPVESLGKVLPGIAKMHKPEGFEGLGSKSRNVVIILDSSGSMKNPESGSCAIIGAFAIARKYIETGGKVGVINFSWKTKCLKPSRNSDVFRALAEYQGGGTELKADAVVDYVSSEARGYDVVLITDAGINNIGEVRSMLEKLERFGCRNYVIWIASKSFEKQIDELSKHAKIIQVNSESDVPRIVLSM
ncbi:MAG: hypothetical protein DSY33_00405 [Archaeoglobus sp.]|nr:MAG: hypothetical protein DSY33_00405 [Archaeoglobus sp.]